MTVNLDLFMQFRDLQVAEDVGKMAALGWFDTEFTMHGASYLTAEGVHYMISSHSHNIYTFLQQSHLSGYYPTPLLTLSKKCPVPAGEKDAIAQQVKLELARGLEASYPKPFLQLLHHLGSQTAHDGAKEWLLQVQDAISGLFVEDLLQLFQNLLDLAYRHKVLTQASYAYFSQWLAEERADMIDDVVLKDLFTRTFYGFAYETAQGYMDYYLNAQKETVYAHQDEMEAKGLLTTPILSKPYWYNYTYRLKDVKAAAELQFKTLLNEDYLQLVKKIQALPSAIDGAYYAQCVTYTQTHFTPAAQVALAAFGRRWHC